MTSTGEASRVRVTEECVGVAQCVAIAPEAFEMTDEGYSTARLDSIPPQLIANVRKAVRACPTGAIELID